VKCFNPRVEYVEIHASLFFWCARHGTNLTGEKYKNGFNEESIFKVANARLGWYKRCSMDVVNYILPTSLIWGEYIDACTYKW